MKKGNLALLTKLGVSDETIDNIFDVIECRAGFISGEITPQNVAQATRKALINLVNELLENMPECEIENTPKEYEEGYEENV